MPRPKGSRNKSKVSSKTVRDILLGRFRINELEEFLKMKDKNGFSKNLRDFYFEMIPKLMPKIQELEGGKASSLTINLGAEGDQKCENHAKTKEDHAQKPEAPFTINLNAQAEA